MMNPNLLVNGVPLDIGVGSDSLDRAQISRPGLLQGLLTGFALRPWPVARKDLRWSMNPTFQLFDDVRTRSCGNDLEASSLDAIYGTSAFVVLVSDKVAQIHLQLFKSLTYARGLAHDFRKIAFAHLGPCRNSEKELFPCFRGDRSTRIADTAITVWGDDARYLVCELGRMSDHCVIRYVEGPLPRQIEARLTSLTAEADELWEKSEADEILSALNIFER